MTEATEMLVGASVDFLCRHSPFNRMEREALEFLASRLALAFHPKDSVILSPEMGQVKHFFIIQRGKVQARQTGNVSVTEYSSLNMDPGECFPIGAISAQRPSTNTYIAVEDSFCFQLPAEDFMSLMQMSPVFHLFCTQYIASLLNQSRQQLQIQFSQRAAEQQTMTTPLGQLIKRDPVSVTAETVTRAALQQMADDHVGCMVVVDADRKPIGILTQSDLLTRLLLPAFDLSRPIGEVMSASPHVMSSSASAYDAALEMATHGVRHLLVVDAEERLLGVVSERDLFSLQRIGLRQIRAGIESASDVDALQQASRDIRQLALNLIAQGIGAEQLTRFISALNDALTCRIIELCIDRHELHDAEFAWLAFGSEGRHEQTLSTDQDNGLIYVLPEGVAQEAYKLKLIAFARSVNEDLAACGFPLCKGNIMASNPELCLTLAEWKNRFGSWIREPDPKALLNASIFFDFRSLYGIEKLAEQLRSWLLANAKTNTTFLHMMAGNALTVPPPLGRIRDFVTDDDPQHPGTIDLKKSGARLFVDAARILSLRTGVTSSSTVQRLRQAGQKLGWSSDELSAIIEGFNFIQLLRLRSQHLDTEHDAPGDNRVNPDQLNELDRRILKEAFRQARKIQLRLKLDYQL
ncbi:MAG: CBS domain-containing protein [Rhodocyclaceae bacterium]|nr:CBS domain-containing protein [Rhodocyclaceae bacterium]MCP5232101.1 CBS domain-containing protein [Zoogloeaceae bacterium]MCB1910905.1 CBS domain-containing protein [Rhodocyclaceae bacterium]MCP5238471.1 CBS domain-containing protein [Zoogloeaceae bacterium]MCP5254615.1 CBS domain-containing protein [Zoogloeaceae bacterium]